MSLCKRLFVRLMRVFFVLALLLLLTAGAGLVYYFTTRLSPWDFVSDDTTRIMILENGLDDPRTLDCINALPGSDPDSDTILRTLGRFTRDEPGIGRLLETLGNRLLLAETTVPGRILIADAGWKSLFVSGGLLAVRSIYNPGDSLRFSLREYSAGDLDFNIYRIELHPHRQSLSLALIRNILLIATGPEPIVAAIRKQRLRAEPATDWKSLAGLVPPRGIVMLAAATNALVDLPFASDRTLSRNDTALSLEPAADETLRVSIALRPHRPGPDDREMARVLDSNQYRPAGPDLAPAASSRLRALLFDDLAETLRVIARCRALPAPSPDPAINDWAANEIGGFRWNNAEYFYIRVLDRDRALGRGAARSQQIRALAAPAFLEQARLLLAPGPQPGFCLAHNDTLVFAQHPALLAALATELKEKRGLHGTPEMVRFKGLITRRQNLLVIDDSAAEFFPALPALARIYVPGHGRLIRVISATATHGHLAIEIVAGESGKHRKNVKQDGADKMQEKSGPD